MNKTLWLAFSLGLMACTAELPSEEPALGGQFGEEDDAPCVETSRTALAMDEVAANGIRPQDLVDAAAGTHTATLTWSTGGSTSFTVEVTNPRDAAFVEYDASADEELGGLCPSAVEITTDMALTTDDGALAESFTTQMSLVEAGPVRWVHELAAPQGTFDPADYTATTYDRLWAWIHVTFDAGIRGMIEGQGELAGEEPEDTASDGSVSATNFEIATF